MKLLFDQNLSHRLVKSLALEFPQSAHVRHVGLEKAPDGPVWDYAKQHGFVIVSKDSDVHQRSFLYGSPAKSGLDSSRQLLNGNYRVNTS